MKKYIFKIFLFFAIVVGVDQVYGFICSYMIEHTQSGDTALTFNIFKKNKYDIMILGSSRCVCHYDDKMMSDTLGVKVINAGTKGNGIIMMYGLYNIIPQENKPKLLVYDVEPAFDVLAYENDDHDKRYLSGLKFFYKEPIIKQIFESIDSKERLKMYSHLYQYNSYFFPLAKDYLLSNNVKTSCYEPSYKKYTKPKNGPEPHRDDDGQKLYYFEQLIKDTKRDGVHMVVVASPKYNEGSCIELQPIEDLCKRYNVPFLNYYLDMQDTKWFCNRMHLNYDGSQEYTKVFSNRLQKEIKIR